MSADATKIAIYSNDDGTSVTNTYNGINPALNEAKIRDFVDAAGELIDGDLVKFVRTDQTTYYPVAAGSDTPSGGGE